MNIWGLVSLLSAFVIVYSAQWILTKLTNLHSIAGE